MKHHQERSGDKLPDEYLPPGTVLAGQYRLLEITGEGGMGVIYRAVQESVGRDVAVKVLRQRFLENETIVRRFENEARIISQLRHPNTIRLYDCQRLKDGHLFIVTEFLQGSSLYKLLRQGPLPIDRVVPIVDQICGSLSEAHAAGVVHRDLKPENIFLDHVGNEDHVKVLDFGIAKLAENSGLHTQPDILIGTPAYMAPEQASGEGADARSDIYAVGILLFQMISGFTPFRADTPVALLVKQIKEPAPSLRRAAPNAGVSPELEAFVMRLLAKSPNDRPQSVDELRDQLREVAFRRLWTTPLPQLHGGRWTPPPAAVASDAPPPPDPRAVRALMTQPDLVLGDIELDLRSGPPMGGTRPGRSDRQEITPPPDHISLDLPLFVRHPSLRILGTTAFLAVAGGALAWFFHVTGPSTGGERQRTFAESVELPPQPKPSPDPMVIPPPPRPMAEVKTKSATQAATKVVESARPAEKAPAAATDEDEALDRAIADHLKPAPKAEPPKRRAAVRPVHKAEPEPDLDKTFERLTAPAAPAHEEKPKPEPPPKKKERETPVDPDGPMPVEIE